ncbi:MAG: OmpA family protein [Bacteroidota bacterium]
MKIIPKRFPIKIFALILISSSFVLSQSGNESLLKEVKALQRKALSLGGNIFSASDFEKGTDLLKDAEEMIKDKSGSTDVTGKLTSAKDLFRKASESAQIIGQNFSALMKTRQLVIEANSGDLFPEQWNEAEKNFANAFDEFNDSNPEGVKKYSDAADKLYKEAEVISLKNKYTMKLNEAIEKADDDGIEKYAPLGFKKAKQFVMDIETTLGTNRYDTVKARNLKNQGLYEINHGLYLKNLFVKMDDEDKTREDLILTWEEPLAKVAAQFKVNPLFDSGSENVTTKIIENIKSDKSKIEKLEKDVNALTLKVDELNKSLELSNNNLDEAKKQNEQFAIEISRLKKVNEENLAKLTVIESENIKFKTKAEQQAQNEQMIKSVSDMFLPSEAEVVRNGDLIVIRLINMNFPTNKATLDPQYFNLLNKVQKAIQTFPNGTVVLEGHTDGQGDYQKNLELSQNRASSIYQYLLSTMGGEASRISVIGMGSSKPIANNASEEGKAKNRRIEVIINPNLTVTE